jgi:NAD(P)-dependent dehydrogenase (short-subunit alcohol dehydrogenase family)
MALALAPYSIRVNAVSTGIFATLPLPQNAQSQAGI